MHNEEAVAQYQELVGILSEMPIPVTRRNLEDNKNVRWLRKKIQPNWHPKASRALEILELCDEKNPDYCGSISPVWQEIYRRSNLEKAAFIKRYADQGLRVSCNTWPGKTPKIYSVMLDFTPEEWVDLANIEGEFLPACCGTISAIRDILLSVLRHGGDIQANELADIVDLIQTHDGECDAEGSDPLARLVRLWNRIKDDVEINRMGFPVDVNDIEDAFKTLYNSSGIIAWNGMGDQFASKENEKFNHMMTNYTQYVRVLPAIKTIYEYLHTKKLDPIEGWAITCGGEVLRLGNGGLAIYRTRKYAERTAKDFNDYEEYQSKKKPRESRVYNVRPVRVSLEKGLEFKD